MSNVWVICKNMKIKKTSYPKKFGFAYITTNNFIFLIPATYGQTIYELI